MADKQEIWKFAALRLIGEVVTLLVVSESSGSSPGRSGYKMAVASDGELCGSIGGGVMEVSLVERAKSKVQGPKSKVINQIHRRDVDNASGMICSGRQTVVIMRLTAADVDAVNSIIDGLRQRTPIAFEISNLGFGIVEGTTDGSRRYFSKTSETEFVYQEKLGEQQHLYIIGGGHCALALSDLASKLDFRISIFDDRPELNTIAKNQFADAVIIIDSYENIGEHLPQGDDVYVVVMTLGYRSDAVAIRQLIDHEFKYFGVLGSKAKMATLMKELRDEGFDQDKLARIHTPIGLPINSRTPEEIAVSIAAEIIKVRNA
ncbi:MAG: XdhC family protein [Blastocatellia bacterium]|nr:XdhC family protein [Blastocatellia bacterium]